MKWMKLMLKELGEIITGNTPSKQIEEFWNSEDICFIKPDVIADSGVNEISESNEYISEEARKKARVVSKNAIFVTCIGSIGKIGIAMDGEYAFNQQINAIIPNEKIDSKYLAYNLLFNKQRLIGMANAPVVPIINKSQFGEFTLNIEIDSDKQSEIVKVLDKLMDIIKHRKNELFALDALIKARFVEMFGNPVNNEKGFVKAPMGDYMTLLTDFSSNGSYKTLDSGVTMYDEPNYAWMVRTTDLESGDMTSIKYIDENAYELLAKSKIYGGEIIMNKIGSAGKIYLMPQIDMPASLGRNAFMFRYDDRINVKFLYHLLTSEYGQREIQQYVRGAVTKTITKNDVRAVLIMVPPIELQNEFEAFVKQVDKSKVAVQKTLDETKLLFDSLMQKYFG
jgi:type I restriction enzyme S subunit